MCLLSALCSWHRPFLIIQGPAAWGRNLLVCPQHFPSLSPMATQPLTCPHLLGFCALDMGHSWELTTPVTVQDAVR